MSISKPTISIKQDGSDYEIVLENSCIRSRYGLIPDGEKVDGYKESCMVEFLDKTTGYDAAAFSAKDYYLNLDNGSRIHEITSAKITRENDDYATVYLCFGNSVRDNEPTEQEVTIFKDCKVLQIYYINRWHTFEWCAERRNAQARLAIWGDETWYKQKGWDEAHKYNWHESGVDNGWYYHSERDGYNVPLNYNDHLIGGVYQQDGKGFLRVFNIYKLDHYIIMPPAAGFETWDNRHKESISYLAPISGGRSEIFSLGQACADDSFREAGGFI